jgi:predicted GH43/DUF377 family glycosyl hydrolase
VNSVFNAGAVRLESGQILLLCRVEDMRGISHLCAARSADGVSGWEIDQGPTLMPRPEQYPEEVWGIEDPRITYLPECERYAVAYTCYSVGGPGVSLAFTEDFREFERLGIVLHPDDKDAAVFPSRFDGRWAMLHRPSAPGRPAHVWLCFSPDLRHWGDFRILLEARRGAWWDGSKIGVAAPPIKTDEGWLVLYHGVKETAAGALYRVGLALLGLEAPEKVVLRGDQWVFGPREAYERTGDVGDVVFPCGAVLAEDGDTLLLYYGAADTSICLATGSVSELLDWLEDHGEPGGQLEGVGRWLAGSHRAS